MYFTCHFRVTRNWSILHHLTVRVLAPGTITVKYNSKTVQHLEGGMLKRLLVQEGMKVEAGDILIELENTQIKAETEQLNSQYLGLSVQKEGNLEQERLSLLRRLLRLKGLLAEGFAIKQTLRSLQREYTKFRDKLLTIESGLRSVKEKLIVSEDIA